MRARVVPFHRGLSLRRWQLIRDRKEVKEGAMRTYVRAIQAEAEAEVGLRP